MHQEDFCQTLGVLSKNKYQAEGGPAFAMVFKLLFITENPVIARLELARRVMFNFLIGNNDAHAKNVSLLYKGVKPVLAPAYDVLSTAIYPECTTKMAMSIGAIQRVRMGKCARLAHILQRSRNIIPMVQRGTPQERDT